jgi:hypothetical protein
MVAGLEVVRIVVVELLECLDLVMGALGKRDVSLRGYSCNPSIMGRERRRHQYSVFQCMNIAQDWVT